MSHRRAEEAARAEEIAELEGMAAAAEGRFATLAEEAEAKTRKLKKLLKKFKVCSRGVFVGSGCGCLLICNTAVRAGVQSRGEQTPPVASSTPDPSHPACLPSRLSRHPSHPLYAPPPPPTLPTPTHTPVSPPPPTPPTPPPPTHTPTHPPSQEVDTEVSDLYSEFQREKEDLLDSIRQLHQQMLLKDAVIAAFIPQVGV